MIKEFIATGETVEIAFNNAIKELNVNAEKAKMEVLEEPVKKTLGLFGGSPAKVRAYVEITPADKAAEYVKNILAAMGVLNPKCEVNQNEDGADINLFGEEISFVIGHRGETLDSLQYLASLVANQGEEKYVRISLNIGNFREKRKETLENLGKKMAGKAIKYGRNQVLEPMNPYERRIIHFSVQSIEGAKSWSEGEDLLRHVVIGPEGGEKVRFSRNNNSRGRNNNFKGRNNDFKGDRRNNRFDDRKPVEKKPVIKETVDLPFSPAPLDDTPIKKKAEDAPLYGRIR